LNSRHTESVITYVKISHTKLDKAAIPLAEVIAPCIPDKPEGNTRRNELYELHVLAWI